MLNLRPFIYLRSVVFLIFGTKYVCTESEPALKDSDEKGRTDGLMGRSLQDLIAIGMPYMLMMSVPIICASFVYDPTMRVLLYAMLPENWKTGPWFWACFAEELHFVVTFITITGPAWQLQVISFELVNVILHLCCRKVFDVL